MSNIFEIDGEIEDNDDDGKNSGDSNEGNLNDEEQSLPEGSEEETSDSESDEEESVSIVFGNAEDGTNEEESSADADSSDTSDTEVPWFDKVLNDEDPSENEGPSDDQSIDTPSDEVPEEIDETLASGTDVSDEEVPRVEDVTQEEIDEVLAELDQSEKEMEAYGYDEEEAIEEDEEEPEAISKDETYLEEEEESFDDIFPPSNRQPIGITAWIFLMLFLIMLSLFSYYQFYDGEKFSINFHHKSEGAMTQLDSLAQLNEESQTEISQLMTRMETLTQEIRQKTADFEALKQDTSRVTYSVDESGESAPSDSKVNLNEGTYYQVQLIALSQYHPDFEGADFSFYVDKEDGFSKMLMGAFLSEDQAKDFYEKVQRSGFNDAFVVKKVNGTRVEYDPNK